MARLLTTICGRPCWGFLPKWPKLSLRLIHPGRLLWMYLPRSPPAWRLPAASCVNSRFCLLLTSMPFAPGALTAISEREIMYLHGDPNDVIHRDGPRHGDGCGKSLVVIRKLFRRCFRHAHVLPNRGFRQYGFL